MSGAIRRCVFPGRNRQRIAKKSSLPQPKLLLERGIEGIGVDALAKAAGKSHGAVYSHFGSKEDLAAAAIREALTEFRKRWIADAGGEGAPDLFNRLVRSYVSRAHRDNPGRAAPSPLLDPMLPAMARRCSRRSRTRP